MSFPWTSLIIPALAGLVGCAATVDKESVKAAEGAPQHLQVETLRIPYDRTRPKYVVVVAPFEMGTEGSSAPPTQVPQQWRYYGWGPWGWWGPGAARPAPAAYTPGAQGVSEKVGTGIAAQLVSALSNVGNVTVIDFDHYSKNKKIGTRRGERGPFIVKGTVTEFNEVAEAEEQNRGGSLGWVGTVAGLAGAYAGVPGAVYAGSAVSAANPTYENTKARRTGAVGMDLQLVEPGSGRVVGTITASGKFTAESATSGVSVFGIGGGNSAFAATALGQATRAATNDAARQIMSRLASNP